MQFRVSIITPGLKVRIANSILSSIERQNAYQFELFHDQLPLAVPCYDLLPVTEFTVVPHKAELRVLPAPLS